jgi:hypothetical protein
MGLWNDPVYVRNYMREYSKRPKQQEYQRNYRRTDKFKAYFKTDKQKAKKREYDKKYQQTAIYKEWKKRWGKEYSKRPEVRVRSALRARVQSVFKGYKGERTMDLLHCSIGFLMNHLESQFQDGMTWDNYGKWHIDHIVPLIYFEGLLQDIGWQRVACHWSNLRPAWAGENLSKGGKERFLAKGA